MGSHSLRFTLILVLGLLLTGCGAAATATPQTTGAGLSVSLTTNPDPPKSGNIELVVQVSDQGGQPVTDAEVSVVADHIDMSGMILRGKATAQGGGRYATAANFSMSGNWKVTVEARKGAATQTKDFRLAVR